MTITYIAKAGQAFKFGVHFCRKFLDTRRVEEENIKHMEEEEREASDGGVVVVDLSIRRDGVGEEREGSQKWILNNLCS